MIESFRHKGLKRLYQRGDRSGVNPDHVERIENILSILSVAECLSDIDLPSLRLHAMKGDRKGFHAVTVRANWRIVFRFENGTCQDVDLVDYH
ncbi:peptidase [Nitrospirales bacterium NOB]|nr:type II toxin-antitoxin system RelE/ParE family toxin [Burkholderiaceae bacterium]MCZ2414451.1 type II toxin-antitoxin system RelE/ParE family toxin [Burkholderiales bacterium]MDL1888583.1 peptidase [Nitrospirales bacterium NOB]RIK56174.1 MAG: peptidase [Nitrospira sp.]